jgi:hypothetical protein
MLVIINVTNCSSVPGGRPASRGATCAQAATGTVGSTMTGAPISQRPRTGPPLASRGV